MQISLGPDMLSLVPRPCIREERTWYRLLVHVPDLHGNPQKNVEYHIRYCTCYHGDSAHAQEVCTRPSPLVSHRATHNTLISRRGLVIKGLTRQDTGNK